MTTTGGISSCSISEVASEFSVGSHTSKDLLLNPRPDDPDAPGETGLQVVTEQPDAHIGGHLPPRRIFEISGCLSTHCFSRESQFHARCFAHAVWFHVAVMIFLFVTAVNRAFFVLDNGSMPTMLCFLYACDVVLKLSSVFIRLFMHRHHRAYMSSARCYARVYLWVATVSLPLVAIPLVSVHLREATSHLREEPRISSFLERMKLVMPINVLGMTFTGALHCVLVTWPPARWGLALGVGLAPLAMRLVLGLPLPPLLAMAFVSGCVLAFAVETALYRSYAAQNAERAALKERVVQLCNEKERLAWEVALQTQQRHMPDGVALPLDGARAHGGMRR